MVVGYDCHIYSRPTCMMADVTCILYATASIHDGSCQKYIFDHYTHPQLECTQVFSIAPLHISIGCTIIHCSRDAMPGGW